MARKHAFRICQKNADGIQKEVEIGRGKIEDCSEAKMKEISSGATCCLHEEFQV